MQGVRIIGGAQNGVRDFEKVNVELEALRDDPQPVALTIDKVSAWVLVAQLQLALRHPANNGPTSEIARHIATTILEGLSLDPDSALARLAEQGWQEGRIIIPQ